MNRKWFRAVLEQVGRRHVVAGLWPQSLFACGWVTNWFFSWVCLCLGMKLKHGSSYSCMCDANAAKWHVFLSLVSKLLGFFSFRCVGVIFIFREVRAVGCVETEGSTVNRSESFSFKCPNEKSSLWNSRLSLSLLKLMLSLRALVLFLHIYGSAGSCAHKYTPHEQDNVGLHWFLSSAVLWVRLREEHPYTTLFNGFSQFNTEWIKYTVSGESSKISCNLAKCQLPVSKQDWLQMVLSLCQH